MQIKATYILDVAKVERVGTHQVTENEKKQMSSHSGNLNVLPLNKYAEFLTGEIFL